MSKAEKTPEVGEELIAKCGKCKDDTMHVATVIEGEKVKKAMCKTCNAEHLYRAPKTEKVSEKKKRVKTAMEKARSTRRTRRLDWDTLRAEIDDEELVEYQLGSDLTDARAIRHKTFGVGVITKVLSEKQVEVRFREDTKILVHNYEV